MNLHSILAGIALSTWLTGCSFAVSDPGPTKELFASAWVEVGAAVFEVDGETAAMRIPVSEPGAGIMLRATTDPRVCFQLSSARDDQGRAVVDGRSAGEYCRDCDLRTSMAVESGVFILPTKAGRFEPDTGVSVRFALVDCETLTPVTTPEDRPVLRVAMQSIAMVPEVVSLDLRLVVSESSVLFGDEKRQEELVENLGREFSSTGIVPRMVEVHQVEAFPAHLDFHAGDQAALAAVMAELPPKAETTMDVVVGGCLRYDDPFFGPPRPVDGYTPRVVGGAGPADGVFLPGLDCVAPAVGPVDISVSAQAHVLAHEIGHYLGLYHAVEADGFADRLDDTDSHNAMFHNPAQATAVGFSAAQGQVMRMHLTR